MDIEVVTSNNTYRGTAKRLLSYENWDGIRIFRLNTPKSNVASTAQRLLYGALFSVAAFFKLLLRRRYDLLVLVTNPPALPIAAQALKRVTGTPYVYIIYDLYPDVPVALNVLPAESRVARAAHRLQHGWLKAAAKVVVLGRCMSDYLAQHYQLLPDQIAVIPNWSDPKQVAFQDKNTLFRANHGLKGPVVLYAGNFGQYQDFDALLNAAKILQTSYPDMSFVFVGEGAKRSHICERIENEGIENVRVFPFVPKEEFSDLLASADISLVTLESGVEGLGVPSKFYNILASGRPTVAAVGAQSEVARVLEEWQCGVRVDQGDPQQLAHTITGLLAEPDKLASMGENARKAFLECFTIQHCGSQFMSVFTEISSPASPAPRTGVSQE